MAEPTAIPVALVQCYLPTGRSRSMRTVFSAGLPQRGRQQKYGLSAGQKSAYVHQPLVPAVLSQVSR